MDIETIKQLQDKGAAIVLLLKEINIRNTFREWHLVATFEILDNTGRKSITSALLVQKSRARHSIVRPLQTIGLSFAEIPLSDADRFDRSPASRPDLGQCRTSCHLCVKTDFDHSTGCYNSQVFSAGVGDWICNYQPAGTGVHQ